MLSENTGEKKSETTGPRPGQVSDVRALYKIDPLNVTLMDSAPPPSDSEFSLVRFAVDVSMVFGPVLSYVAQYLEIRKNRSASGFSLGLPFVLITSNTLRLWFRFVFYVVCLYSSFLEQAHVPNTVVVAACIS